MTDTSKPESPSAAVVQFPTTAINAVKAERLRARWRETAIELDSLREDSEELLIQCQRQREALREQIDEKLDELFAISQKLDSHLKDRL